ncbi:hypothetical protein BCR32DRAFT_270124 [Anaeromyces robustus]|uniref:DUF5648 domain-containing protein n=1 Tax=Anaeromyces robustus TaxID=1754192 RepID=A0A1Y1WXU3_9FUNG|nr:hypothetical protein BCR32DRAFT_270124 [Anaeromyces robustus]|eukprot:ORX78399.1 hypothetical protein BCR32DRAFT_270124 [Anaeromyces robustus]
MSFFKDNTFLVNSLENKNIVVEEKIDTTKKINELNDKIETLENKNNVLEEKIETTKKINELNDKIKTLESRNNTLEEKLEIIIKENRELKNKIETLENCTKNLQDKMNSRIPVYRLYNPNANDHLYVLGESEMRYSEAKFDYHNERIEFYAFQNNN